MKPEMMKRCLDFVRQRGLSDADMMELESMMTGADMDAMDAPDPFTGRPRPGGAMDAAIFTGTGNAVRVMQAIRAAEEEVSPVVGPVLGMDSASAVFCAALKRLGQDTGAIHPSAMMHVYRAARRRGVRPGATMASTASFEDRFPDAARIRTAY